MLFLLTPVTSYNILVLFPHPGKSHFDSFVRLFIALAEKGHNVTVISYSPLKESVSNYRDIEIGGIETFLEHRALDFLDLNKVDPKSRLSKYLTFLVLAEVGQMACETGFTSRAVQSFLKENNHFDVAIIEYFNSDCFVTVAKKYNIPVVRAHSSSLMPWSSDRYGNPTNPAYIPNNFMPFSNKMNFLERVENAVLSLLHSAYYNNFVVINRDRTVSTKYFGELGASMHSDVLNDSLLLTASHYSLNFPTPLVPNIIEVGGLHIGKPKKLPKVR